ncbi:homocysteine S-methyltransferase family protein [Saccharothrix hoggarensis]|uniref:Homocysteine S-methyltransferase family protein n=1 Tax=Saccharothrix hoggarensis TaxID=913853 RepID=A0ABW3R2G8_9PSEU
MSDRVTSPFPDALADRVVVADGATGAMPRSADLTLDDFAGHEGCHEILDVTGPDVVRQVRRGYPEAGADAVGTDTFGANPTDLAGRGTEEKIFELSRRGAEPARETADEFGGRGRPWTRSTASPRHRAGPVRIGVELSDELQPDPERSPDAFVAHHPEAKHFNA